MAHVADEEGLADVAPRALWRNGEFLVLWSGQAVSTLGSTVSTLALPLLVLALTSSPAQVGFIAAAQAIPYLLLALPAGALIDHWNRKALMIRCDVARFLALGSVPLAAAVGHVTVAQLYLVALIAGTALVFFNIAQTAALTHVVPVAQLPRASALDQTVSSTAALIGPGLAGAIVAFGSTVAAGAALAFLVDSLSYLASVLSLLFIRIPFQQRHPATVGHSLRADIVEGLRFLWTHRRIRALALVSIASVLVYGSLVLSLIVLAQKALHADARLIGPIFSDTQRVPGGGALLGSLLAPWIRARVAVGRILVGVLTIMALATALLAVAPSPALAMVGWASIALTGPIYSVTVLSYRLGLVPDALQGRVTSVFRLLNMAGQPLSLAVGGLLLAALGPRPVLWIMVAGGMLTAIVVSRTELCQV